MGRTAWSRSGMVRDRFGNRSVLAGARSRAALCRRGGAAVAAEVPFEDSRSRERLAWQWAGRTGLRPQPAPGSVRLEPDAVLDAH